MLSILINLINFYSFRNFKIIHRCIVTSLYDIVVIQLRHQSGQVLKSWTFYEKRKTFFFVPINEARRASLIVIEDINGNLLRKEVESLF